MADVRHCSGHNDVKVYEVTGRNDEDVLGAVVNLVKESEDTLLSLTYPQVNDENDIFATVVLG